MIQHSINGTAVHVSLDKCSVSGVYMATCSFSQVSECKVLHCFSVELKQLLCVSKYVHLNKLAQKLKEQMQIISNG